MILYAIRHKATGKLMPQAKKDRGYSNWNPSIPDKEFTAALDVPRLVLTERTAIKIISAWVAFPNGHMHSFSNYYGEEDLDVDFKDDGRKKEDLEVVKINLKVKGPNNPFWSDL